jgi:hypothetical protein
MVKIKASGIHLVDDREQNLVDETGCRSIFPCGLRIRADVHVGAWWCDSCVGKTEGSQLISPNCGYCQIS